MVLPSILLAVFCFSILSLSARSTATASDLACQHLQKGSLRTIVSTSGNLYESGATSAWNLLNANLQPTCVIFPRTTEDVSKAMEIIYKFDGNYAVQAGGHSAMQGWNNVQDGILIHLKDMNNISYDSKTRSVTFQPGVSWGQALDALERHGVAVAGGRVSDVGTGLLLGGGISYLAPQVGYSADTMREVDVVLVTGEVVTATATNAFSDLFRALKGGANRYGIVTRYVVDAIPTGTKEDKLWYGGQLVYANSSVDAVLTALAHYALKVDDPKSAMLLYFFNSFANNTVSPLIVLNAFYNGDSLPETVYGEFLSIPAVQKNLSRLSYYDVANLIGDPGAVTPLVELFGASVLEGSNNTQSYRDIYSLYATLCENFKGELGGTTLSFTPVSNSQILAGRTRGGNAIDAPRGGFHMIQFSMSLPVGAQNVSVGLETARQTFFRVAPRTLGLPLYINESDKNQSVFPTYGGYDFLKKTYQKYDPTRFNVRHTNGPSGL
ncbi:hypothetical protein C0995_014383 [Termitomyces sp. Mi166|nr:hypothetical protein C0995_014383 [Termitomyces sp. Mi166\